MAREFYGIHTGCLEFGWFEMTHFVQKRTFEGSP